MPYGNRPGSAGIPAGEFQQLGGAGRRLTGSLDQDHSADTPVLQLGHATRHNLNDLTVAIPLGRFVCVTGVSGSGKSTLIREVLLPALSARLKEGPGQASAADTKASDRLESTENSEEQDSDQALVAPKSDEGGARITHQVSLEGWAHLSRVVLVDQSILGKTPRSNPAVYIGAFDDIREFFAQSEPAKQRGLNASAFSFNSAQGQCERCRGAGFEKIEMQFLSDVFIRCPDCDGRRYRPHILEVKLNPGPEARSAKSEVRRGNSVSHARSPTHSSHRSRTKADPASRSFSIADLLEATVEDAIAFLAGFPYSRPAQGAMAGLKWLEQVGLGYLQLGQPINTLSGGESQRLKLVRHLAEVTSPTQPLNPLPTLFLFDEPTTGLHFDDVRVLLKVFQRLVDAGHSVVVIEHNLDVIKCADWIIDLGPEAGDQGGQVVAEGIPEEIMACPSSHTGHALRQMLSGTALGARALAYSTPPVKGTLNALDA
jgi:excinuclease ABC subunit A